MKTFPIEKGKIKAMSWHPKSLSIAVLVRGEVQILDVMKQSIEKLISSQAEITCCKLFFFIL